MTPPVPPFKQPPNNTPPTKPTAPQVLSRASNAAYNAIAYDANTDQVRARIPLYGYLMLQQALAGGADVLARSVSGGCKVWLLRGRKAGDLRAVIINKDDAKECAADLRLGQDQQYASVGEARYMYASAGLDESWRIYYSGTYFAAWGSRREAPEQLAPVKRYTTAAGSTGFALHLTKGTVAALVTIPLAPGVPVPKAGTQWRLLPAAAAPPSAGGKSAGGGTKSAKPAASSARKPSAQASQARKKPATAASRVPSKAAAKSQPKAHNTNG